MSHSGRRPPHDRNLDNTGLGWFPRWLGITAPLGATTQTNHWGPTRRGSGAVPGNLFTEQYPSEPLATYTPEEAHLICPMCGVPEIHWRQHQNGALHQTGLAVAASHCRSSPQASASPTAI
ncbi:hypothetical protein HPB50_027610 [Hyalomma asiaticum]|nr:hypothetical protein HPB50_027610 [Hyalomma asiaticum]